MVGARLWWGGFAATDQEVEEDEEKCEEAKGPRRSEEDRRIEAAGRTSR